MYKDYLDKCMTSETVRNYLKKQELKIWQALCIIIGSPISIYIKLEELQKLKNDSCGNIDEYEDLIECEKAILRIKTAIEYLCCEGIYTIEEMFFDYGSKEPNGSLDKVCRTLESVQEHIRSEELKYPPMPEDCKWYNVTKWIDVGSGQLKRVSNYYMVGDSILYADIEDDGSNLGKKTDCIWYFDSYYMGELRIPVPFKAGDILEVNGYPFGPKYRMLILEIGDNLDCCSVQGLTLNREGRWESGAVKHGIVSYNYNPRISSLFSAKIFGGALPDNEKVLYILSQYIGGSEEKGHKFNEKILLYLGKRKNVDVYEKNIKGLTNDDICFLIKN